MTATLEAGNKHLAKVREVAETLAVGADMRDIHDARAIDRAIADLRGPVLTWAGIVRARVVADACYLRGVKFRDLGEALGLSHNAPSLWVEEHGPSHYVAVVRRGAEYEICVVAKAAIQYLRDEECRIAPSVMGLHDPETGAVNWAGSAEQLWNALPELVTDARLTGAKRQPAELVSAARAQEVLSFLLHTDRLAGIDDIAAADRAVMEVREVATVWAETLRGRLLADLHHLKGMSMRALAGELGYSHRALGQWISRYAASKYVTVFEAGGEYVIDLVPRAKVKELRGLGRSVAPSVLGYYDDQSGRLTCSGGAETLWASLPEWSSEDL